MPVDFISSEVCIVDGKKLIYFAHPLSLFRQIEKKLAEVGAEKFFSNPDESTKRAREGLPQYFFTLALKRQTGMDWWVLHPSDPSSDFFLMAVKENPIGVMMEQFELVQIPSHFQTFDQAFSVVQDKINKGYPHHYNLLIFVNHEKSKEWATLIHEKLPAQPPFKTVGVVYLMFEKGTSNPYIATVHRLRPLPVVNLQAKFSDSQLYKPQNVLHLMEEIRRDGHTFVKFKPDIEKAIITSMRRFNLARKKQSV